MKHTTALVSALLASTSFALPTAEQMTQRRHERLAKSHSSGKRFGSTSRPLAVNPISETDFIAIPNNTAEVTYSSNWAGAIIESAGVTSVTGTFTIPTEPSGGSSSTEYGASAWVGIDGNNCGSAILQTGVEFFVEGTQTLYQAWYPDYSYSFANFAVAPGQQIQATVHATSKTSGTAVLKNLSTGQSVTHTFSNEGGTGSLCETDAEWIVEDFQSGSALVPFANFGSVTFTGASYTHGGTTTGVSGASIIDVEQNGKVQTNCAVSGSSVVKCTYLS
ncbi:hypothetical protein LTR62_008879 [Meristemomyces frigidus]|uniref:Acid proteinase n=1 Tax=Meristemomyces frigidus TaxID=1508187 RepID=A0AAN7TD14_9PEZI|nr:hypothetical protein LTR62_008879 [Meristemomyces frigidus]